MEELGPPVIKWRDFWVRLAAVIELLFKIFMMVAAVHFAIKYW